MINFYSLKCIMIFLLPVLFFSSCKKDEEITTVDTGYNYFPGKVGNWIVYDVDSIFYDFDSTVYKYQIKESIESEFVDNEGRPALRLERYIKYFNDTVPYSSMQWSLKDVWYANKTATTFEKIEENIRYVKLVFPVRKNKTWNGNAQNTLAEMNYEFTDVDVARSFNSLSFDSTTLITQLNNENFIKKQLYTEVFARNVGLIYKEIIDIDSQCGTAAPPCSIPIMDRIQAGFKYKMVVNSYGTN